MHVPSGCAADCVCLGEQLGRALGPHRAAQGGRAHCAVAEEQVQVPGAVAVVQVGGRPPRGAMMGADEHAGTCPRPSSRSSTT